MPLISGSLPLSAGCHISGSLPLTAGCHISGSLPLTAGCHSYLEACLLLLDAIHIWKPASYCWMSLLSESLPLTAAWMSILSLSLPLIAVCHRSTRSLPLSAGVCPVYSFFLLSFFLSCLFSACSLDFYLCICIFHCQYILVTVHSLDMLHICVSHFISQASSVCQLLQPFLL